MTCRCVLQRCQRLQEEEEVGAISEPAQRPARGGPEPGSGLPETPGPLQSQQHPEKTCHPLLPLLPLQSQRYTHTDARTHGYNAPIFTYPHKHTKDPQILLFLPRSIWEKDRIVLFTHSYSLLTSHTQIFILLVLFFWKIQINAHAHTYCTLTEVLPSSGPIHKHNDTASLSRYAENLFQVKERWVHSPRRLLTVGRSQVNRANRIVLTNCYVRSPVTVCACVVVCYVYERQSEVLSHHLLQVYLQLAAAWRALRF